MMLLTQFNFCCLVFLFTKVSAAVVNNGIDSSNDYELVKGLSQKQDPVDFRFTKFLDIQFDVGKNSTSGNIVDIIRSRVDKNPKGIQNNNTFSNCEAQPNKYILEKLEALTNTIQSMSLLLTGMNRELIEVRRNNSLLSENKISVLNDNDVRCSIPKSPIGVTYSGLCSKNKAAEKQKHNNKINIPRDCREVQDRGNNVSGVYEIQPKLSLKPFLVLCDMKIRGGGWTHVQKRFDGSQDFYLDWREYKFGFGDLDGEFWLGLENIYYLTSAVSELLVELVNIDQTTLYAHYKVFKIGPEPDGYPLSILSDFSGDAGDYLKCHLGQKFSTKDYDQDSDTRNCAETFRGGWWYNACICSNLNGKYINRKLPSIYINRGPCWNTVSSNSLAKTRILVRQARV